MASTYCQPIAHSTPHSSTVKSGFQFSEPPTLSDASRLGCAARFNLSAMDLPAPLNGRGFQAPPAVGQSLLPAYTAQLSEDGEIFDSENDDDDDDLPSVKQILASSKRAKQVIDLTGDDGEGGDGDFTETASGSPANSVPLTPPSLIKSPAHTADDLATSSTAATSGKKKSPWINTPPWSPLHRKLQQRSDKPLDNLTVDTLHPSTDSSRSPSTELEPAPRVYGLVDANQPFEISLVPPTSLRGKRKPSSMDGEEQETIAMMVYS